MTAFGRATFTDGGGHTFSPSLYTDGIDQAANTLSELQNYSDAAMTGLYTCESVTPPLGGGLGEAYAFFDCMHLIFRSNALSGNSVSLLVPAPYHTLFLPDNETVNPVQIQGLIDAVLGHGTTPSGLPLTDYIRGYRRRVRRT